MDQTTVDKIQFYAAKRNQNNPHYEELKQTITETKNDESPEAIEFKAELEEEMTCSLSLAFCIGQANGLTPAEVLQKHFKHEETQFGPMPTAAQLN